MFAIPIIQASCAGPVAGARIVAHHQQQFATPGMFMQRMGEVGPGPLGMDERGDPLPPPPTGEPLPEDLVAYRSRREQATSLVFDPLRLGLFPYDASCEKGVASHMGCPAHNRDPYFVVETRDGKDVRRTVGGKGRLLHDWQAVASSQWKRWATTGKVPAVVRNGQVVEPPAWLFDELNVGTVKRQGWPCDEKIPARRVKVWRQAPVQNSDGEKWHVVSWGDPQGTHVYASAKWQEGEGVGGWWEPRPEPEQDWPSDGTSRMVLSWVADNDGEPYPQPPAIGESALHPCLRFVPNEGLWARSLSDVTYDWLEMRTKQVPREVTLEIVGAALALVCVVEALLLPRPSKSGGAVFFVDPETVGLYSECAGLFSKRHSRRERDFPDKVVV